MMMKVLIPSFFSERPCSTVERRRLLAGWSDARRNWFEEWRKHLLHERRAAVPGSHGHSGRVLCHGPVQGGWFMRRPITLNCHFHRLFLFSGGSEAPQQDKLEEVWDEGGANGAVGTGPEGAVDVPWHAWAQFQLQGGGWPVQFSVPQLHAARCTGVSLLAAGQGARGLEYGDKEEIQVDQGEWRRGRGEGVL